MLQVLQRDVESHGKTIRKLIKVCERYSCPDSQVKAPSVNSFVRAGRFKASEAVRYARNLEHRWLLLYLRSVEWSCHIENVKSRLHNSVSCFLVNLFNLTTD